MRENYRFQGHVTTDDRCSACGVKLENAETSRLEYQGEAHRLAQENAELRERVACLTLQRDVAEARLDSFQKYSRDRVRYWMNAFLRSYERR